jgi:phospholipid-binding lipoprotein MlaA
VSRTTRLKQNATRITAAALAAAMCACASAGPPPEAKDTERFEKVNRGTFWANDKFDVYFFEHLAKGWEFITHRRIRQSIDNAFYNVRFPQRFLANGLQAQFGEASEEVGRFLINTTVGIGGLFNPAGHLGLDGQDEDFGQAFGRWGFSDTPYFVIPLLGPSNGRDAVGQIFDSATTFWIGPFIVIDYLNSRAMNLKAVRDAKEASLDFYSFARDANVQSRRAAIANEDPADSSGPSDDLYETED